MWWGSSPDRLNGPPPPAAYGFQALTSLATAPTCLSCRFATNNYLLLTLQVCLDLVGEIKSGGSDMVSEPTEEAIANFVSFTSSTREQAISFLKVSFT